MKPFKLLFLLIITSLLVEIAWGIIEGVFNLGVNLGEGFETKRLILVFGPALILTFLIYNKWEARKNNKKDSIKKELTKENPVG